MTALWRLFVAVETLIRRLIFQAAERSGAHAERSGAQREALLREAIEALEALVEAATAAPWLLEDTFATAAMEQGAPVPEVEPEVEQIGQALEAQLVSAAETAQERSRKAFETVTKENADEAAHDAVTGLVDAAGHRLTLGSYAQAVTAHAQRKAATEGLLAGLPDGRVRFSKHGTTHPICKPLEGRTFPVETAPRPPMHPGCKHRLEPV